MSARGADTLRFTSIYLENWRNFTSVELPLQKRAFVVGPNASGKSNLLDAFRFLRDIAARRRGGFYESIEKRGGVSNLRCLAARQYPAVAIRVDIGSDRAPKQWTYELRFKQDNRREPYIENEIVWKGDERILARPDEFEEDSKDPKRLTQTFLEQLQANQPFRPIADFFETVDYLHIVPQLIREPERSVGRQNDPYGADFLEQLASSNEKTRNAWLRRIERALAVAVPQLQELRMDRDNRGTPHLWGTYKHWRPYGKWQREEQFSDGTLRLLGLLWVTLSAKGPLLLEEPELSLHPEVVRHLPQMFARMQRRTGRQVLVSSHAPDLLRDEGVGLDEVLLLRPDREGTRVRPASSYRHVHALLEGGLSLPEAVMPYTKPDDAGDLPLFGEEAKR